MGDQITLADVFLVPQVYNAIRFGVDVEKEFPNIHEITQNLNEVPEFIAASAHN